MKLLGREPALWIATVNAVIVILGTVGFHYLTGQQAGLWVAAINLVAGAATAYLVRPVAPAAFASAVAAIAALVASYGINVAPETLAAINLAIVPVLALLTRGQVAPQDTPVSNE